MYECDRCDETFDGEPALGGAAFALCPACLRIVEADVAPVLPEADEAADWARDGEAVARRLRGLPE